MRAIALLALKIVVLTVLFVVALTIGNLVFISPAVPRTTIPPDSAAAVFNGMLLVALVDTLVVALIVLRSRWRGWRLALAIGFSLYGVMTFMAQIETAWFAPAMTTMRITPARPAALPTPSQTWRSGYPLLRSRQWLRPARRHRCWLLLVVRPVCVRTHTAACSEACTNS
jgi:hypothetical protein